MKNLVLLFLILLLSTSAVWGQSPAIVETVEVAGISNQRLSADLGDAIRRLVGQRYDAAAADRLANRIQGELPGMVAAVRIVPGADAARVRVVFVVAQSSSAPAGPDSNVNSQYTVESVEVKGLERSMYSTAIHEEMQKMVGQRLDNNLADDLRVRLSGEVRGQYHVSQKIERGSMPEHVKLVYQVDRTSWLFRATLGRVFDGNVRKGQVSISTRNRDKDVVEAVEVKGIAQSRVSSSLNAELQMMVGKLIDQLEIDHLLEKLRSELGKDFEVSKHIDAGTKGLLSKVRYEVELIPWLPYRPPQGFAAYHQKQGLSVVFSSAPFINKYFTFNAALDGDSLTERYKGLALGLESRHLGTRHLGARLEFATYGVQWKQQTRREAGNLPALPGLYRSREVLAPSLAFAFNRHVYVIAGANLAELEMEGPPTRWQSVHEGVASIHYDSKQIKRDESSYQTQGSYEVRTGARSIGSSYSFTRHSMDLSTTAKVNNHTVKLSAIGGTISGNAPLFERFTLGNTQTLRGWNKYDIDPLGGNRVWHTTIAYQYSGFGFFLDQGAIWGDGLVRKTRRSVGLGLGNTIGIAMPLDCAGHCGVTFFANFKG
jgi:outer membrane protein assembly factor BamA